MKNFLSDLITKDNPILTNLLGFLLLISYIVIIVFFSNPSDGYHRVIPFRLIASILLLFTILANYRYLGKQLNQHYWFILTRFTSVTIVFIYWCWETQWGQYVYGGIRGSDLVGMIETYYEYTFYGLITLALCVDLVSNIAQISKCNSSIEVANTLNMFLLILIFTCFLNYKISFNNGVTAYNAFGVYRYTGDFRFYMSKIPGANLFNYRTVDKHAYSTSYIYCNINTHIPKIYARDNDLEVEQINEFCENTKSNPIDEWWV